MRRNYVVPIKWMVIYEYEVPGGVLSLSSTKLPRPWSHGNLPLQAKNPHDRAGNQTRDLMISSQKLWPLDHEAGLKSWNMNNLKYTIFWRQCGISAKCTISTLVYRVLRVLHYGRIAAAQWFKVKTVAQLTADNIKSNTKVTRLFYSYLLK
jgi:hypothetical protein